MELLKKLLKLTLTFIYLSLLVFFSITCEILSGKIFLKNIFMPLAESGKAGIVANDFFLFIFIPAVSASIVIGLLGGYLNKRSSNKFNCYFGYIPAAIYGAMHYIHFWEKGSGAVINLFGTALIILSAGFVFFKLTKAR